MTRKIKPAIALLVFALILPACNKESGPAGSGARTGTDAARPDAEALLTQMSDKLKSLTTFTVSTKETNERVRRNDQRVTLNLDRQISVRRPDRAYMRATGDLDLEIFYNGKLVTLVTHKDKVFGELPAPPTIAETAEMLTERYGIPVPIADLMSADPKAALKNAETTGGFEKREAVDGVECNKLAYQHPNVDFAIWLPVSGEPLPKKLDVVYKARRGKPASSITFRDWNPSAQLSDDTFARKIPPDYEGIPVIQRAAAVEASLEEQDKAKGAQPAPPPKK